jgi:signal transduction histidine kinase
MKAKPEIQIICAARRLARQYVKEVQRAAESFQLRPIIVVADNARQCGTGIFVFLLDQSGVQGQSKKSLNHVVKHLVEVAPVIVVAAPERQSELTGLLTSGAAEFVARMGKFVPLAVGLVARRISLAMSTPARSNGMNGLRSANFGEIFRHEVNNPLTGILGNAEMLLAKRDRLPASVIERLETIAHLAVRLRETVRRLSSADELRPSD